MKGSTVTANGYFLHKDSEFIDDSITTKIIGEYIFDGTTNYFAEKDSSIVSIHPRNIIAIESMPYSISVL